MTEPFHQILGNNLVANVTNFTVWFALTFWVYLETQSVFATGMIAGIYLVFTAASGILVRQPGRPQSQEAGHAGLERRVVRLLCAVAWRWCWLAPEGAFANRYGV